MCRAQTVKITNDELPAGITEETIVARERPDSLVPPAALLRPPVRPVPSRPPPSHFSSASSPSFPHIAPHRPLPPSSHQLLASPPSPPVTLSPARKVLELAKCQTAERLMAEVPSFEQALQEVRHHLTTSSRSPP